jgi:hypothetical protein
LSDQADLFPPPPPPPSPICPPVSPEWDTSLVIIFPLYSPFSLNSIFKGTNCPDLRHLIKSPNCCTLPTQHGLT